MAICKINGCTNQSIAKGLCGKHYEQHRRKFNSVLCKEEGCTSPSVTKGYCSRHYRQYLRYNTTVKTRFDENKIEIFKDHATMEVYNIKNELKVKVILDIDDVEKVKLAKWKSKGDKYISTSNYNKSNKAISLGELIIEQKLKKGERVFHKNDNFLDYRKDNLYIDKPNRKADKQFKHNTTGYRGVYKMRKRGVFIGKYSASITYNRTTYHLGTFSNIDEAIQARKEAEIKYWNKH